MTAAARSPGATVTHLVVGVDVGGTSVKAALIDADSPDVLLRRIAAPTPQPARADEVLDIVAVLVDELARDAPALVTAIGLAVPGVIDESAGRTVFAAVIDWPDVPVAALLSRRTGLPVGFGHDVRTAGWAEWQLGSGRDISELMVVCLGTGIGAAVVSGGAMLRADGYAGQLGHLVVDPSGPPCGCGQRGCVGRLASATALVEQFRAATQISLAGAEELVQLVRQGDRLAGRVWAEAVDRLVDALLPAQALLGSQRIVLTGGLGGAGELLASPVRSRLHERLTFHRLPEVVPGRFGRDAGLVGAGLLAIRTLEHATSIDERQVLG